MVENAQKEVCQTCRETCKITEGCDWSQRWQSKVLNWKMHRNHRIYKTVNKKLESSCCYIIMVLRCFSNLFQKKSLTKQNVDLHHWCTFLLNISQQQLVADSNTHYSHFLWISFWNFDTHVFRVAFSCNNSSFNAALYMTESGSSRSELAAFGLFA